MFETIRRVNCGSHRVAGEARGWWIPVLGQSWGSEPLAKRRREEKVLNEELMERVLNPSNLKAAYEHVKANGGAPGVDGMSVEA